MKPMETEVMVGSTGILGVNWVTKLTGMPMWKANRNQVWADATEKLAPLLEVCPTGKACRVAERTRLSELLVSNWTELLGQFKIQIDSEIASTKGQIVDSHEVFVQCQIDDHCCPTETSVIKNWYIVISDYYKKMNALRLERIVVVNKMIEIEKECPDVVATFDTSMI